MKYLEIKATLKERLLFLLFSMLREDLVNNPIRSNKESNKNYNEEIKPEVIPFFDDTNTSVNARLK